MDKRVIELLNADGVDITWDEFRDAYDRRRVERNPGLAIPARRVEHPRIQVQRLSEDELLERIGRLQDSIKESLVDQVQP
jgi:hypothetical protein